MGTLSFFSKQKNNISIHKQLIISNLLLFTSQKRLGFWQIIIIAKPFSATVSLHHNKRELWTKGRKPKSPLPKSRHYFKKNHQL